MLYFRIYMIILMCTIKEYALVAALKSSEAIGCRGVRNFVLCKMETKTLSSNTVIHHKAKSGWRTWLHKFLSLKILSH